MYINRYFSRQSKPFLITLGLMLIFSVGVADYITGAELSISIFYLLPISIGTWFLSRRVGFLLSIISSTVGLVTDIVAGHTYSHPVIVYWNNAVQMGFFIIIVFILTELKIEYERTVRLNTDLQETIVELKRTKNELERKAHELTRSNQELERFAYVAAHDLKGPLIVAGGHINRLQRLYKDKLDANAERLIRNVIDAIKRMEALINNLLAYARVGTKTKELKLSDFNHLIKFAISNLQVEIEKNNASVTYGQLPTLVADDIQIIQLFQNLIGNGIKFHKGEPPHVHVSVEQKEKRWVFSVSDNGIGIEPKNVSCIFNIFQRLPIGSGYQGNGIGLAICKKIVENHRGEIWVESDLGKGSTFHFIIPIEE
jgi:signal transduction histidine kinase